VVLFEKDLVRDLIAATGREADKLNKKYERIQQSDFSQSRANNEVIEILRKIFSPFNEGLHRATNNLGDKDVASFIEGSEVTKTVIVNGHLYVGRREIQAVISQSTRSFAQSYGAGPSGLRSKQEGSEVYFVSGKPSVVSGSEPVYETLFLAPSAVEPYRKRFALARSLTTRYLQEVAASKLTELSKRIWEEYSEILKIETARGRMDNEDNPSERPLKTFVEGILSLHDLLGILLSKAPKNESYSGKDFLEHLLRAHIPQGGFLADVTRRIPLGWVGPLGLANGSFINPLGWNSAQSRFRLPSDVRKSFTETKQHQRWSVEQLNRHEGHRGVCPFAALHKNSEKIVSTEMQLLSQNYLEIFSKIYGQLDSRSPQEKNIVKEAESQRMDTSGFY
jgi:hypothetical protein